jgi:hypothetical protein
MRTRAEELWTRFLADGRLGVAEEQELLDAMESDGALRERLLTDKEFDGLLGAVCAGDDAAFEKSFQDRLAVEGDSKFIRRVEKRIHRAPPPNSSGWIYGIAAAAIAAILVVIALSGTKAPAPVVKIPVLETPPPPKPFEPPPVEVRPVPRTAKSPEPKPVVPEAPTPKPEESPAPVVIPDVKPAPLPTVTEVVVAKVGRADGEVSAPFGHALTAGRGLEVGKGAATILYADGTKLDLGAQTTVADLLDAKGKTLTLEKGVLTADVVKQAQPMILKTPHAEIRVLGTTLKVTIEPGSTRLDVLSGKVRLIRALDNKYVDVITGHYAIAGAGVELVSKSSTPPKPKPPLFQETFQGGLDRWKAVGTPSLIKAAGRLDIDLSGRTPGPDGWNGAGLITRQAFPPSMALTLDVDLTVLHPSVVAAVVFLPQGQKRGGEGVFRLQLRGNRYSLTTESGEARDVVGADRAGAAARERWRIEVDGGTVRFLVNDVEILKSKHGLPVAPGYAIEIDGSARADAPSGARVGFDTVVIEALK